MLKFRRYFSPKLKLLDILKYSRSQNISFEDLSKKMYSSSDLIMLVILEYVKCKKDSKRFLISYRNYKYTYEGLSDNSRRNFSKISEIINKSELITLYKRL